MTQHYVDLDELLNDEGYEKDELFFNIEALIPLLDNDDWNYIREVWPTKSSDWTGRLVSGIGGALSYGFPEPGIDGSILVGLAFDLIPSPRLEDQIYGLYILLDTLSVAVPFIGDAELNMLAQLYQQHPDVRREMKRVSTNAGFAAVILKAMGVEAWPE